MKPITGLLDNGYDDIVTFGNVLSKTVFYGNDEPIESLLDYFESPHKWESEYQKWRELGGTLDDECLRQFENWYDYRRSNPEDVSTAIAEAVTEDYEPQWRQ